MAKQKKTSPGKAAPADPKAAPEIKGKSAVSSFLRIAKRWRESAEWGHPSLAEGAKALEAEAEVLDPGSTKQITKDNLLKQTEAARLALAQAEGVLADPKATPEQHESATKALKSGSPQPAE